MIIIKIQILVFWFSDHIVLYKLIFQLNLQALKNQKWNQTQPGKDYLRVHIKTSSLKIAFKNQKSMNSSQHFHNLSKKFQR